MISRAVRLSLGLILGPALLLFLSACEGDGSGADAAPTANIDESTSSASPSDTPSTSPTYTAAQSDLLRRSSIRWSGNPDTLFDLADQVCIYVNLDKSLDGATDLITGQTSVRGDRIARGFAVDIVSMYCPSWAEGNSDADNAYWNNLGRYIDYVKSRNYHAYIGPGEVIPDSASICAAGKRGDSYGEVASRIRRNYFNSEAQVKDYIEHAFKFMCPRWTVAYVAPAPPAAATDFYDGTYRVASTGDNNIQPGTYAAKTGGDGCYWERNDANGNILDNYFGNGLRVQVTIYSSDYSFNSNGCGHWKKIG